jgi:hypothetical protein
MESKQYILATIKIPIEASPDGNYEPLSDFMTIIFDKLEKLPELAESDYGNESIKKMVKSLLDSKKLDEETAHQEGEKNLDEENEKTGPIILAEELILRKSRTHKKNLSFKNKSSLLNRFTQKVYG